MAKASKVLNVAKGWLGKNEKDGSYKEIIDTYNSHKPLPNGYAVKYTDEWCATFVSAVAIKANATDIIPLECSCGRMVELAKSKGIWVENENRVPNTGDICLYDWDDGNNYKTTNNTAWPDHVGIVESVSDRTFNVIEGNYSESVKRRTIQINGRYIRGFIAPKYEKETVKITNNQSQDSEKIIWDYLMSKLKNAYGVAGLMGNLYAESGLISNNAQNTGNSKLGMTDVEYTKAVDNNSYKNFVKDAIGYGLAQWTYWTRKESLLNFAKSKKKSVGDLNMQLEFLVNELAGYKNVYKKITNAKSIREASDSVLTEYERPADMSEKVKVKRAEYGQKYYNKYASKDVKPETVKPESTQPVTKKVAKGYATNIDKSLAGKYKVTASGLHLRDGAGVEKSSMIILPKNTIVDNYGYYSVVNGVKWLYIQVTINGVQYTGFSSSKYLKRQ